MNEDTVSSEVNAFTVQHKEDKPSVDSSNRLSVFSFQCPEYCNSTPATPIVDKDGDLVVQRQQNETPDEVIIIEHAMVSTLNLVGNQIWRGAFLLADYILHNSTKFQNEIMIELAAGVGFTSIAASMIAKEVIATDVDLGNILKLIKSNIERNSHIVKSLVSVLPLDFYATEWSEEIKDALARVTTVMAADVVYHDNLTDAFCTTLNTILSTPPHKTAYIALEKRYVFTVAELDICAPCYDHFCNQIQSNKHFKTEIVPIDFLQYFNYERTKELTLWKVTSTNVIV